MAAAVRLRPKTERILCLSESSRRAARGPWHFRIEHRGLESLPAVGEVVSRICGCGVLCRSGPNRESRWLSECDHQSAGVWDHKPLALAPKRLREILANDGGGGGCGDRDRGGGDILRWQE